MIPMRSKATLAIVIAGVIAVVAIGGVVFVGSGVYNIGADDHHTKIVLALIEQLREHSIGVRARSIDIHHSRTPIGSRRAHSTMRRCASAVTWGQG